MYTDLNAAGTTLADRDVLSRWHRNETSSLEHTLRSHVGIGSEAHCLFGRARTAAATSSCVTCLKLENTQSVDAKLGAAVLEEVLLELKLLAFLSGTLHILLFIST